MKLQGTTNLKHWLQAQDQQTRQRTKDKLIELVTSLRAMPKQKALRACLENISLLTSKVPSVSCKAGCSHCCYQSIHISDEEADLIIDYLNLMSVEIDKKRLEKQSAWGKEDYYDNKNEAACVFLSPEGKCNIYPVRPSVCRTYLVSSDPAYCDTKYRHKHPSLQVAMYGQAELFASALWSISLGSIESLAKKIWFRLGGDNDKKI